MAAKSLDFAAIPRTALRVITSPVPFFKDMPKSGGFAGPLLFMVVMAVIAGVVSGLLHALTNVLGLRLYTGVAMGYMSIILMPLLAAIWSAIFGFIAAGVLYFVWKLLDSQEDFEAAYRCTAYLAAILPITTILGIIPYCGGAISLVVMLYYLVTASVAVHGVPARKAWLVFGLIAAFLAVLSISAQITAGRFERNMEQAAESWKDASEQMKKSAEEIQKQMQERMKEQKEKQNRNQDQ